MQRTTENQLSVLSMILAAGLVGPVMLMLIGGKLGRRVAGAKGRGEKA